VRCAVFEDPPWRSLTSGEHGVSAQEWGKQIAERRQWSQQKLIEEGQKTNPTWSREEFDDWSKAKQQVSPLVVNFIGKDAVAWVDYISRIQCPALLVTGDTALSSIVSPEVAAEAAGLNPLLRVKHIAGAGHNIRREQFDAYLAAVQEFLAQNHQR
jgi:N-formylmaleamate deformylase